ncbi:MAG: hypothetical protein R3E95_07260 [Thiolinea sp.]
MFDIASDSDTDGDGIDDTTDTSPNNPCLPVAGNTFAPTHCADLSITKTGGTEQGSCATGEREWVIAVSNAGPADAAGVKVADVLNGASVKSTSGATNCLGWINGTPTGTSCDIPVGGNGVSITVCTQTGGADGATIE